MTGQLVFNYGLPNQTHFYDQEESVGTIVFGRCSHQAELVNLCGLFRPSSFLFNGREHGARALASDRRGIC